MKIILVDDNAQFLGELKFFIENKLNHKVIGEAKNGNEFLSLKNINEADIILMDLMMGNTDGFQASAKIRRIMPWLKILAMTMSTETAFMAKIVDAGMRGVINKNEIFTSLESALKLVSAGEFVYSRVNLQPVQNGTGKNGRISPAAETVYPEDYSEDFSEEDENAGESASFSILF